MEMQEVIQTKDRKQMAFMRLSIDIIGPYWGYGSEGWSAGPGDKDRFSLDSLSKTGYLKPSVFTPGPGSNLACLLSLASHSCWLPPRTVTTQNKQDIDSGTTYSWRGIRSQKTNMKKIKWYKMIIKWNNQRT